MSEPQPNNQEQKEMDDRRVVRGVNVWALILLITVGLIAFAFIRNAGVSVISMAYFDKLVEGNGYNDKKLKDGNGKPLEGSNIQSITLYETYADGTFHVLPPPGPKTNSEGNLIYADEGDKLNKKFRCLPAISKAGIKKKNWQPLNESWPN